MKLKASCATSVSQTQNAPTFSLLILWSSLTSWQGHSCHSFSSTPLASGLTVPQLRFLQINTVNAYDLHVRTSRVFGHVGRSVHFCRTLFACSELVDRIKHQKYVHATFSNKHYWSAEYMRQTNKTAWTDKSAAARTEFKIATIIHRPFFIIVATGISQQYPWIIQHPLKNLDTSAAFLNN